MELVQVELCPQKELLRTTGAGFYRLDVLPVAQPTCGYLLNVFSVLTLLFGCCKGCLFYEMCLFTRRRSIAEYWKYFVARFNDVHAFGYNFSESEWIWIKFGELRVYCLDLALTDFGHDPRRSESGRPCGSLFFLSGKQRTTLLISGQPNFTKFAHKT